MISLGACQTINSNPRKEYSDISHLPTDEVEVDSLQKVNLIIPNSNEDIPILIWIGGGAWSYMDRNVAMDLGKKLVSEGIAMASVGHRLSPTIWRDSSLSEGIEHPKHVKDLAAAVNWLYEHASECGYDQDTIFIGGYEK